MPLLIAAALFLAGGCGERSAPPPPPPDATVAQWWRAVAAGDAAAIGGRVSGVAGDKSTKVFAEYARVRKAAGEGDPLARRMLERLEGVRIGGVRGGSLISVAQLVLADGKPFLTVYLESRDNGWLIVDLK